jgi:hypothetical protein
MNDCCCSANLIPVFSDGSLPEEVRASILPAFNQAFQSDKRGTRLNDILAFGRSAAIQICLAPNAGPKQMVPLDAGKYFGCSVVGEFREFVSSLYIKRQILNIILTDIRLCTKLRIKGVVYHTAKQVPRDANVMIRNGGDNPAPAQVQDIFIYEGRVAAAVRRHLPFSQIHAERDPYRQFASQFAGILYYAHLGDKEIIPADDLLFHFAKTPFVDSIIGECIHVLPLAKVFVNSFHFLLSSQEQQDMLFNLEADNDEMEIRDFNAGENEDAWMDVAAC